MLRRKGEMMQKKLFTLVCCAVCCGEPTLSRHTHTQTQMSSCTAESHRLLFSNETLRAKHGTHSLSNSSVVHNKAPESTQMKRKLAQLRSGVAWPAVRASFYISRLMTRHMSSLTSEASLQLTVTSRGSHQPLGTHLCLHSCVHLGGGSQMSLKAQCLELLGQIDMNNEQTECHLDRLWWGRTDWMYTLKILIGCVKSHIWYAVPLWGLCFAVLGEEQSIVLSKKDQTHKDENQVLDHKNAPCTTQRMWQMASGVHLATNTQSEQTYMGYVGFFFILVFIGFMGQGLRWDFQSMSLTSAAQFCWSVCASNILLNAPTLQNEMQEPLQRLNSDCRLPNEVCLPSPESSIFSDKLNWQENL